MLLAPEVEAEEQLLLELQMAVLVEGHRRLLSPSPRSAGIRLGVQSLHRLLSLNSHSEGILLGAQVGLRSEGCGLRS